MTSLSAAGNILLGREPRGASGLVDVARLNEAARVQLAAIGAPGDNSDHETSRLWQGPRDHCVDSLELLLADPLNRPRFAGRARATG